ncbi:MAG: 2-amino-4-hydroxy-6-hydroxymethyldihydropteridine diphosphokinase [Natronospirillum sp.]
MGVEVLLSLGSNVDREHHIRAGLDALQARYGALDVSPVYESSAVGFNGPDFYNLVVAIRTADPLDLVNKCLKQIEDDWGRERNQPTCLNRTLDIDVLTYGSAHGVVSGINLPRSEVYRNAFVLKPLADLRPRMRVPGDTASWADLWAQFSAPDQRLQKVELPWQPRSL